MPEIKFTPEHPDTITDGDITTAMYVHGGSFVRGLGELWRMADDDNRERLRTAFPEYWSQYRELVMLKRQQADPRRV